MSTPSISDFFFNTMTGLPSPVPDEPEKVVFGIDLGTLQSRAVIGKYDEDGSRKLIFVKDIPSVVTFTEHEASKCIVGSFAKIRAISTASNTFCVTKYLIGRDYEDPVVQKVAKEKAGYKIIKSSNGRPCMMSSNCNQVFTPSDIAALILLKLKEFCEVDAKIPIKNVVITTPAYFTETQIQATREAAQMAGLNVLKIMDESTAAVLAYGANQTDKTVVVYDFGGTFQVSVVQIRNGEPEVKSTVHDLFLGGDDFDNVLVNYFVKQLKRMTKYDCSKDISSMQWLKKAAEHAKIDLSSFTEIRIDFFVMYITQFPKRISIWLKRSEFEELVVEFINKTIPLCHKALKDAKVSVSDINEVFAIGGISMMPKVKATVEEIFGKPPSQNEQFNRKTAVAFGAALTGHVLAADLPGDNVASVEVSPDLPKPVKQTDKFNYTVMGGDKSKFVEENRENVLSTGIHAVLTEREAETIIMRDHNDRRNDGDEDEIVNHITTMKSFLWLRRYDTDRPMPEKYAEVCDILREIKNDRILEALHRVFGVFGVFS